VSVLLAGGGTGGHVFPLVAIADALVRLCSDCRLLFVGTRRGLEGTVVPPLGYRIEYLDIRPIRGLGLSGAVRGTVRAVAALPESQRLLNQECPDVVLSVGGYAAGPITLAAWTLGIPTALLEPNSAMGLANLCLATVVDRAYTAFDEVEKFFSASRVARTGVPLRKGFNPQPPVDHEGLRILILGGSQGAAALNELVPRVVQQLGGLVEVLHQCGPKHVERVCEAYCDCDHRVRVVPFIDDMPSAIAWSDVVISRSGASAVSEICAIGRASILIPYPFAAGAHQLKNARALAKIGAAICMESDSTDVPTLKACLLRLRDNPDQLQRMSSAAEKWSRPDAAGVIARDLISLGRPQYARHHTQSTDGASKGAEA
jgi:UDP-N-acetylglucosamine--N-acetylmuramyl-(pentapeptide) pyrophosphoryl-undecaprenol N-acetylglucosamine transferase